MSRYLLYFVLSLGLHAVAGWLLREPPAEAGSRVVSEQPVLIQLVPLARAEAHGVAAPQAAEVRREAPAEKPQKVAAELRSAAPRTLAPPPTRAAPRPVEVAAAPAALAPAAAPARDTHARAVAAAPLAQATAAPRREVFRSKPRFLTPPRPPIYPAQAKRRNQQGVVLVEVRLDEYGKLVELKLLRSSGVASLDRSALDAVAGWSFRAEIEDGQTVPSRVHIPIEFAITASR
jgi:protein TonB